MLTNVVDSSPVHQAVPEERRPYNILKFSMTAAHIIKEIHNGGI